MLKQTLYIFFGGLLFFTAFSAWAIYTVSIENEIVGAVLFIAPVILLVSFTISAGLSNSKK